MSDKDNDKLNQLDDVAAYEAELEAEKEREKEEKAPKGAAFSRYPDKDKERKEKEPDKGKKKAKKQFFLIRFGKWIGRKTRELIAELKKVTWPGFPKVMKETGVVIGIVLFFLVIVFGIDLGLSQLYRLLINAINRS